MATSRLRPVVSIGPGVMSVPIADAITKLRVGEPSPCTPTVWNASIWALKPVVLELARLLALAACWSNRCFAPVIAT